MKTSSCKNRERGMTLLELFVVMAVLAFFAVFFVSQPDRNGKARAYRIQCVNNLKQIGLSERRWSGDHGNESPFAVSQTNGGAMEFAAGPYAFKYFQVMSNELSTPRVLFCPTDSKRIQQWATNFSALSNSNLSYFIGLDVSGTDPQGIVSGDRNVTNGTPTKNGILELTTNRPAGWTAEMHNQVGNLVLADGSVQQVSSAGLRAGIANANSFTNRLLMPTLNP